MLRPYAIPIWKKAPFIRLLLPLIAGIILQWYLQIPIQFIVSAFIAFGISFLLFLLLPIALRFKMQPLQGFIIQLFFIALGAWITWQKDMRHQNNWYGNYYKEGSYLVVRIDEPLVEKNKTYKADGYVETVVQDGKTIPAEGKLLLYFSKDSFKTNLAYGDRIIIRKNLQAIKNSGNPGAFNYQRYAAFQGIFHNVFLQEKDWSVLNKNPKNGFWQLIFFSREYVLDVLQKSISTGKDELGIAEALLIGYTNDLDKDLVQAYSNTGVVHIIAISGMHLALIYLLLVWVFAKIPLINKSKLLQLVLILSCLWLFSILTGASPSVLRAAVMFSFIAIGKTWFKQASIYNSLAASAFVLLCYNPYYLWAVGFQLSYLAVLGIVIFQKPIYNCFYIKNKWVDKTWQLITVSTAAQLLTFPVCIYYFHQFPNLFLISNLIAVPLSAIILYTEIALIAFSWIPLVGTWLGKLVTGLVWLMNKIILWINDLSFAVWDKIPATVFSTWLLYAVLLSFSAWLLLKNKKYFWMGLFVILAFELQSAYNNWQSSKQQKLIVYNVPQHQAIDLVSGNSYKFIGDSILQEEGLLQNFHLKPGRTAQQLNNRTDSLAEVFQQGIFYQFSNKRIAIIDRPLTAVPLQQKINLDLLIISKNPKLSVSQLTAVFNCKQFVFDASNAGWKIEKWTAECKALHVNFYPIPVKGAFIYDTGM
ncbi:MAG: ComEC/Rec2 family competence protein [Chitinophagaceae bacterium]|nr:ComEC/Rec2 family competence protein [Chitinophagaceae bacterium]